MSYRAIAGWERKGEEGVNVSFFFFFPFRKSEDAVAKGRKELPSVYVCREKITARRIIPRTPPLTRKQPLPLPLPPKASSHLGLLVATDPRFSEMFFVKAQSTLLNLFIKNAMLVLLM